MTKFYLTLLLIALGFLNLKAQKDTIQQKDIFEMTLEELMEVEVKTASNISESFLEAPATIYIVLKEQIINRGYTNLIELLDDIPEIEIQHKSSSEENYNHIGIRGVSGNEKFLILMNGIKTPRNKGTNKVQI